MPRNFKQEEYLRKADDADERARQTVDTFIAGSWQQIADSYRELARMIETGIDKKWFG